MSRDYDHYQISFHKNRYNLSIYLTFLIFFLFRQFGWLNIFYKKISLTINKLDDYEKNGIIYSFTVKIELQFISIKMVISNAIRNEFQSIFFLSLFHIPQPTPILSLCCPPPTYTYTRNVRQREREGDSVSKFNQLTKEGQVILE